VYGVAIPGTDGRAGMATIVTGDGFSLETLHQYLVENLPEYACPLFLRLCDKIETTATFKSKANELRREACDPAAITDVMFFNDRLQQAFVKLDAALYEGIQRGDIRL
ncbi:MAG: AMP-binding enzyme, partial [Gammaproteobacteria bacterium]